MNHEKQGGLYRYLSIKNCYFSVDNKEGEREREIQLMDDDDNGYVGGAENVVSHNRESYEKPLDFGTFP